MARHKDRFFAHTEFYKRAAAGTLPQFSYLLPVRDPTTWTIIQQDGPNHLGFVVQCAPPASIGPNHLGLCALQSNAMSDHPCSDMRGGERLLKDICECQRWRHPCPTSVSGVLPAVLRFACRD